MDEHFRMTRTYMRIQIKPDQPGTGGVRSKNDVLSAAKSGICASTCAGWALYSSIIVRALFL